MRMNHEPGNGAVRSGRKFTRRQSEVLSLIAEGYSDKEIARILDMSVKTVSVHLQRVFDKLDVHTRAAAVARWISEGHAVRGGSDGTGRDVGTQPWPGTDWTR